MLPEYRLVSLLLQIIVLRFQMYISHLQKASIYLSTRLYLSVDRSNYLSIELQTTILTKVEHILYCTNYCKLSYLPIIMFVCMYVSMFVFMYRSIDVHNTLTICLSGYLLKYLFVCLPAYLYVYLFNYNYICLYCLSIHLYIFLPACLSICISV